MSSGAVWGLAIVTFAAAAVEVVEALTVVLAMGMTRSWRSVLAGTGAALVAHAGFTAVTGYALVTWLPRSVLQLTVGALLLVFGLRWLRKAILRSSGHKRCTTRTRRSAGRPMRPAMRGVNDVSASTGSHS
jgi:uncharacterized membrane protein